MASWRLDSLTHGPSLLAGGRNADVTGLNALSEHYNHPLIVAPGYFYVHDTCLFHPGFTLFWDRLRSAFTNPATVLSTKPPWTSNIAAFGYGVLTRIGDAFKHNYTKYEAQTLEGLGEARRFARRWENPRRRNTKRSDRLALPALLGSLRCAHKPRRRPRAAASDELFRLSLPPRRGW